MDILKYYVSTLKFYCWKIWHMGVKPMTLTVYIHTVLIISLKTLVMVQSSFETLKGIGRDFG